MSTTPTTSKRSVGQVVVAIVFGLLAVAFLIRSILYGVKWLRHVVEAGANFKALTIWCLIYMVVCAAIAFVAFRFPRAEAPETSP